MPVVSCSTKYQNFLWQGTLFVPRIEECRVWSGCRFRSKLDVHRVDSEEV